MKLVFMMGLEENKMNVFGTEEYGNKDGFKVVCCRCGKEARIVPVHYYDDGCATLVLKKITLELRCTCGNKYGATIHS